MEHTPEQTDVIAAARGNILVSAAAGSGKTAVLTDRIVRRVIDGKLDIRSVLVMTFTEAAARNMKEKIEAKLRGALEEAREPALRQRVSRQISLLPGARISTIHAFCLDVIRNFYNLAQDDQGQPLVEPDFGVDDGIEADLLLRQSLDEWLGSRYEAIDRANNDDPDADFGPDRQAAFYRLIEGYGGSGGDRKVRELILRLHHFLRSLPDYPEQVRGWLADLRAAATNFSDSRHLEALLRQLRLLLDRALDNLNELENQLTGAIRFIGQADRNLAYRQQFAGAFATLRQLDGYLRTGGHDWDQIRALAEGLSVLELPRGNKADSPEKTAFMDLFCRFAAEVIYCLAGSCGTKKCSQQFIFNTRYLFCLTAAEIEADIAAQLPAVDMLFELVLGLDQQYGRRKRMTGMIDFGDFEHLALAILRQPEARQYYRGRFSEVYVDEYQDTSSIQEEIIRAVSDGNCLAVGDIKQSIYRFRHARPRIFIERMERYQNGSEGILHELNKNFRSVEGILNTVNDLFSRLMSSGAGEIDYDSRQALTAFRQNDPARPHPVSLLLVNRQSAATAAEQNEAEIAVEADISEETVESSSDTVVEETAEPLLSQDELNRCQQETLAVVRQMHILHEQGTAWQDMVVLSRTRRIVQVCGDELASFGIPVQADTLSAFMDTPVLRQMEALIHVLDNIRQDIPLAAVLRSEICQGGFSAEDLARIRLHAKKQHPTFRFYHQAVLAYAEEGPDEKLRRRLADCLNWLARLRENEQIISVGELIGLVFAESGWLDRLAAQPDGGEQIRELRLFQQWAEKFEYRRQRGLHAFAAFIESMRKQGPAESPFETAKIDEDAVRIMTIHGSKGLEFPIVFLIGTGYNLSPRDSKDSLLISENLGIGMDFADPQLQLRFPTHLKLAMLEEFKAAGLAEELRLLYVAMTRAMDQLYIVGTVTIGSGKSEKRLAAMAKQAAACGQSQLPDYLVLAGKTYLEWLIMALAGQPGLDLGWLDDGDFPAGEQTTPVWRLEFHQLAALQDEAAGMINANNSFTDVQAAEIDDPAALLATILLQNSEPRENSELDDTVRLRITDPYRYQQAARTPVKLTVSELKSRDQTAGSPFAAEDGMLLTPGTQTNVIQTRGITLTMNDSQTDAAAAAESAGQSRPDTLPAAELGTLLHAFFRYLDLPSACRRPDREEIDRQINAMRQTGIFSPVEAVALTAHTDDFLAFVRSDLAAQMVQATDRPERPIHEEMPFTLVLPASQVYADAGGLGPLDKVLIQGIIDCWFEQVDGITLVDYKSDRLPADPDLCHSELEHRYSLQLDYYAQAIRAATGKAVTRRLVWLIRQGRAVELAVGEAAL